MRVKVIRSSREKVIENKVNEWLSSGEYEVIRALQSQDGVTITITIFYRKAE